MSKACLIIVDGMGFDTSVSECGYLEGSVELGEARRWKMRSCLPTISAPLYETLHTGVAPHEHGIFGNEDLRASRCENVFSAAKAAGKTTGVAAHSFFHTLYGGCAYDPFEHCEIDDADAPIPYARYYSMEGYRPDNSCVPAEIDLCAQLWQLANRYEPNYLMMHSCSVDTLGHWYTSDSPEYRVQAFKADNALARLIPRLRAKNYEVVVTADHGMNSDGHHGGNQEILRSVPFYYFGDRTGPDEKQVLDQRGVAPTMLSLIGVEPPDSMSVGTLL